MNSLTSNADLSPTGAPAPITRLFGWITLAVLAAFFVNNILIVGYEFPSPGQIGQGDGRVYVILAIYVIAVLGATAYVLRSPNTALRWEARKINRFNAYLIRGCFFTILFTGIVDGMIAFLRVEGFLESLFSEQTAKDLIRARFIGPYIHVPLAILGSL